MYRSQFTQLGGISALTFAVCFHAHLHATTITGDGEAAGYETPRAAFWEDGIGPSKGDNRRDASTISIAGNEQALDSGSERGDAIRQTESALWENARHVAEHGPNSKPGVIATGAAHRSPTGPVPLQHATNVDETPTDPAIRPPFPEDPEGGILRIGESPTAWPEGEVATPRPDLSAPMTTPAGANTRWELQPDPAVVTEMQCLFKAGTDAFARNEDALALDYLDKADKLVPNQAAIHICKAMILKRQGKIAEAAAAHDRAVRILPKSVPMRVMRVGFRMEQKQYAKAREDLTVAMRMLPGDEGLRFNLILTHLLEKNHTAAKSELEKFKQPSDTAAFYFASSALAYSSGQLDKSIEWISSGYRIFGVQQCASFYAALRRAGLLKVLDRPYYPDMTLGGIKK